MKRPNGLARAAVRFRPAAFAGTFVALFLTVAIVSACGILLETGLRASLPPTRYADAPVVIAADQQATLRVGSGEEAYDVHARVPDHARVDAALLDRLAPLGRAVPDLSFPVRSTVAGAGSGSGEATAHGWGSTAFAPAPLGSGRAPGPGEVVLGADAPATAAGQRITLDTPVGKREFRVAGWSGAPGVWFADDEARTLSGHPQALDAIALLPHPGTDTDAATLAGRAEQAVAGTHAQVLTGHDRAVDGALVSAKEALTALGGSFGGIATMVAVFTAAGTVALGVGQRSREFALLRAVGATPRQIRRTVATEALLVAPVAGVLGCVPGIALATWWFGQLKEKGAVPEPVPLAVSWIPLLSAVGIGLVTALIAGRAAARRPARIRPGQALAAAAVERVRPGWVRTPLGLLALGGGIACAGLAATGQGDDAANAALGVVMLFMLAVALLGPLIARTCAALFGLPLRAAGPAASLAAANSLSNARRLASAITPIVLAVSFSSVLVFLHTSEDRAIARQQAAGLLADHVVTPAPGTTGLASDAAARAAAAPGVTAAVPVTRTTLLVTAGSGGDRYLLSAPAQGVRGDLAAVQDLGVREGSLAALRPGTVAVDRSLADSARVGVGDRLTARLPDGTPVTPEIVAVYTRGLGLGQVSLPAADLAGHTTSAAATELLVRGGSPAALGALGALGTVTDKAGWATAQGLDRQLNAWANTTMAAVLGGFAAIAAANTLVMTVLDRRRELTMLRLVGATRRQVLGMIRWEALLVAGAGLALGTAIALATLFPLVAAITGESPYIPPLVYGAFAAAILTLGLTATTLPARHTLRTA
ncbi:FtsX-like permease family protein [Streptomyces sp. NPDC002054]|uniref:ABC transporter permease n=1 Tax=Streptomyces sp. NPDC002054 TaxID=3154663 RepID=UPI00332411BC